MSDSSHSGRAETVQAARPSSSHAAPQHAKAQHDRVQEAIRQALQDALADAPCMTMASPCAMVLSETVICTTASDEDLRPDVAVFCDIAREQAGLEEGGPMLVVEVQNTDSLLRDTTVRLGLYEEMGIPEYWLVDTSGLLVHAFGRNKDGQMKLFQSAAPGEILTSKAIATLAIQAWDGWLEPAGASST